MAMAKAEQKINIELTERQICYLSEGVGLSHSIYPGKLPMLETIALKKILDEAMTELSNTGAEYNICKLITFDFYREITKGGAYPDGEIYPFSAVDGAHLKGIIKFLKTRFKSRNKRAPEAIETGEALKNFYSAIRNLKDQWYIKNFSLQLINSKKAEIITKAAAMRNKSADDGAERERIRKYWNELKAQADKLIKHYRREVIKREIVGRQDIVDFIFEKENFDWYDKADLRYTLLDRLEVYDGN